jgi:hypothetical protein
MRAAAMVMLVMTGWLQPAISAAQTPDDQQVSIRIDDYAHLDAAALARAQDVVAEFYEAIGVRIEWSDTFSRSADAGRGTECISSVDLTVMVLSASMAERTRLPRNVLGAAANGAGRGGRIAYVLYDRVVAASIDADWDAAALMGVVLAHEVGHLLLPHGSHSPDGLMRAHWNIDELRRTNPHALSFTPRQADLIRELLTLPESATQ